MSENNTEDKDSVKKDTVQADADNKTTRKAPSKANQIKQYWLAMPLLLKIVALILFILVLLFAILFYMAGTEKGTKFLLEKITSETGVGIRYGSGNLRDGLWVYDLDIKPNDELHILIDKMYVKIGWRAMFAKEIHLRSADIHHIDIINSKPPSNEPFDYQTLNLPVNIRLDNAKVQKIHYQQAQKDPVEVTDILAEDLTWVGTKVSVDKANLQYSDVLNIVNLQGYIDLTGDYPLKAKTTLTVNSLTKHYIAPLDLNITGSLKQTTGQVVGRYNDAKVTGDFSVQGLKEDVPFQANLKWQDVKLPYVTEQNIHLKSGEAKVSGVLSDMALDIDTQLTANDIPSGHYQGKGRIANSQLNIHQLIADVSQGKLDIQGVLDWKEEFYMQLSGSSDDFALQQAVPKEYQDFAPYAPKQLDGVLNFAYFSQNNQGQIQIDTELQQKDGEYVKAVITEGKAPKRSKQSAPWYIEANWQNLRRQNVPDVGNIDSPTGSATVVVTDSGLTVNTTATVNELSVAPKGDYQVKLDKIGNVISLADLVYQGEAGDLQGEGQINLASKKQPLTWQIRAKTQDFRPNVYQKELPIEHLQGFIDAQGVMKTTALAGDKTATRQNHQVHINAMDISATLDKSLAKQKQNRLQLSGQGDIGATLQNDDISDIATNLKVKVAGNWLSAGDLVADIQSVGKKMSINTLDYQGEAGKVNLSGQVDLKQATTWNVQGAFEKFNLSQFASGLSTELVPATLSDSPAIITGKLNSTGQWQAGTNKQAGALKAFDVKFNGDLDAKQLPSGKLNIDASGDGQLINIKTLRHIGDAGSIDVTGQVDVRHGVAWDIKSRMKQFNLAYLVKDMPSRLTGTLVSQGRWGDKEQQINLSNMAITGQLKGQPLEAQGKLNAKLHLPKDLSSYFQQIQNQLKNKDAQGAYQQVNALVTELNADNLVMRWGDNYLTANGDASHLQTKVNITSLDQLSKQFQGEIAGGITLEQKEAQALPTLYIDLVGERISLPNLIVNQGSIRGKLVNLANSPSQLVINADKVQLAEQEFNKVQAIFNGTEQSHIVSLAMDNKKLDVSAVLKGSFDRQAMQWKGVIGKGKLKNATADLQQLQPAQLFIDINQPQVQLAAHCWQAEKGTGKLCFNDKLSVSKKQGQVNLSLQDIDTSLFSTFLPKDLNWQAKLNGKALMNWQQGKTPTINTTLYSDNGKIGLIQDENSKPTNLSYNRVSIIALSVADGLKLRTDINTGQGGKGYAEVVIDPYKDKKPISGSLVLNELNLAILKPFFPGMQSIQGNISVAGGVGGTLQKPLFYGDAKLKNGELSILGLPINLTNINVTTKIRGMNAQIDGEFNSGDGKASLTGVVDWQKELQAKLRLLGKQLQISQPPLLVAEVNPDINIIVRPQQKYVNIEGAVSVPKATLRPPESNEELISQSPDVVVLDRRLIGNIDDVLAISKPWSINADIGVDLGDDVKFRGFGAVLPLAGAVNLTQYGQGLMRAKGVVQVSRRTNVDAFGQSLELNYAQLRFNGEATNPNLSIEAVKEIDGKTVGVRVKGNATEPNITVFNNAGLTQEQAMNALVTGKLSNDSGTQITEQGFKSEVTNNLAAAGLSFGLQGTRNFTNQIGRAFGLQSLTVDATSTKNDTNVNVTGYITPDLYIRYGVGVFNAQNSLSIRYQLTRRVYIEATSATENVVDMVYRWQW